MQGLGIQVQITAQDSLRSTHKASAEEADRGGDITQTGYIDSSLAEQARERVLLSVKMALKLQKPSESKELGSPPIPIHIAAKSRETRSQWLCIDFTCNSQHSVTSSSACATLSL